MLLFIICRTFNGYSSKMNCYGFQEAVVKKMKEYEASGRILVMLNGHGPAGSSVMQILVVSVPRHQISLVDWFFVGKEEVNVRSAVVNRLVELLRENDISLEKTTFVADRFSHSSLLKTGDERHPIVCASSMVGLMAAFLEGMEVKNIESRLFLYTVEHYNILKMFFSFITSGAAMKVRKDAMIMAKLESLKYVTEALPNDFADIVSDEELKAIFHYWEDAKTGLTTALQCAKFVESFDANDRANVIVYGEKFLELLADDNIAIPKDADWRHIRTDELKFYVQSYVDHAKSLEPFELSMYSVGLSYKVAKYPHFGSILTSNLDLGKEFYVQKFGTLRFSEKMTLVHLDLDPATVTKVRANRDPRDGM